MGFWGVLGSGKTVSREECKIESRSQTKEGTNLGGQKAAANAA